MNDVIDKKPPSIGNEPPELPPYLKKRGGGNGRWAILPYPLIPIMDTSVRDNMITLHFSWMMKYDSESGEYEITHKDTRRYRQWLDSYEDPRGIAPHIQFGGWIDDTLEKDPENYDRWTEEAARMFC